MNVIPPSQRPVVPCPVAHLPHARRALAERLRRLREEIANCQHRALEVALPTVAESLGGATSPVDAAAAVVAEHTHAEVIAR